MEKFFDPKSVAVIGASSDSRKVGYSLMVNILSGKKRAVYPITLNEKEILGIPSLPSVLDIQEEIDLAIIAVRADIVPDIISQCGKKHIPNVIVISSGFKETGASGRELEDQISKIAKENNIKLLGPNCLGIIDSKNDFNASFSPKKPLAGGIALLSQSGALGTAMLDWSLNQGVGFSKFISLGNEADLSEIDFLKYLCDDQDTSAVLIYLEKVNNGSEFMNLISQTAKKKPVVILKAGISSRGARAVMSHTGSLAPEAKIFAAACKQSGAILVSSVRKFFNTAKLLSLGVTAADPITKLLVLTNGGGPSVVAADEIELSQSLSLIEIDESVKESLKKVLPGMAAIGNPIDIVGDALAERYQRTLEILSGTAADGILVMLTPQMMTQVEETARILVEFKKNSPIKIFPVFLGGPSVEAGRKVLAEAGLPCFDFPKDVIQSLDSLANGAPKTSVEKASSQAPASSQMPFPEMFKILSEYNLAISGKFIQNKNDLNLALSSCGNGPYAMKIMSSSIIHKTDAHAVRLNVTSFEEAEKIWNEFESQIGENGGVLVQPMIRGKEIIIGMKRDATFGPAVVFGLGGILAEAMKDTSMRIAPIEKAEALKMMQEIKGVKIISGYRGEPAVNFDMLADIVVNISKLSIDHPEIKEIDLNPVIASDTFASIVDARMMI